jgi:oxygen-independent coproporphyrinogen-3 oxidase
LAADAIDAELHTALARDWVTREHGRIVPTELGRRFTNDVIGLFLPD